MIAARQHLAVIVGSQSVEYPAISYMASSRVSDAFHCVKLESPGRVYIDKESPRFRCRNSMLCGLNKR
jgi:hypothetical protein